MAKKLRAAWFWEFIQNLPLVLAFTVGLDLFRRGSASQAAYLVFSFVVAGALAIRFTEPLIERGQRETWRETLTNVLFFNIAIGFFIFYFSRIPAIPLFDLLSGIITGTAASVLQASAAKEKPSALHTFSLAVSFGTAVLLIRYVALPLSPVSAALLINLCVTTIIVFIEYRGSAD